MRQPRVALVWDLAYCHPIAVIVQRLVTACQQQSGSAVQVWLALNNMVVDPKCRAKYRMDSYRKESVMRLKRFLNDLLFDQLPVLKDLQRAIDELSMNANADDATAGSGLILEVVRSFTMSSAPCAIRSWPSTRSKNGK